MGMPGFFDKLKAHFLYQSHPLPDDTHKKYYEIVYGLMRSVHGRESDPITTVTYDGVRNYVVHHVGEPCDETALKGVYRYLKTVYRTIDSEGDYWQRRLIVDEKMSQKHVDILVAFNSALDQRPTCRCSLQEALAICYAGIVDALELLNTHVGEADFLDYLCSQKKHYEQYADEATICELLDVACHDALVTLLTPEMNKVLAVVESDGIGCFPEGLSRIQRQFEKIFGQGVFRRLIYAWLRAQYFDGNETV